MRQGRYRDLTAARFKASLGTTGCRKPCGCGFAGPVSSCEDRGLRVHKPRNIANVHIESQPFLCTSYKCAYRAPTYNSHHFSWSLHRRVRGGAGIDPLEYRLRLLATGRTRLEEMPAGSSRRKSVGAGSVR